MADAMPSFDPQFEELLREVAADPNSSLLRVQRPKRVSALFEDARLGPMAGGLAVTERELVKTYSAELAWMLRECSLRIVMNSPVGKRLMTRYRASGEEIIPAAPDKIATRLSGLRRVFPSNSSDVADAFQLLGDCIGPDLQAEATATELATLSLRLQPSNQARMLAAIDLAQRKHIRSSVHLTLLVLGSGASGNPRHAAWENLGHCYGELGYYVRSALAYRRGSREPDSRPQSWLARCSVTLQTGNAQELVRASEELEDHVSNEHPILDWYTSNLAEQRAHGQLVRTPLSTRTIAQVQDRLPPLARRVINAFA